MPTTQITPTELKIIQYSAGSWALTRDGATGNPPAAGPMKVEVQGINGAGWTFTRAFWWFDTMDIPSFATITGAHLHLHNCTATYTGTAELWYGTGPSSPIVAGDYDRTKYSPSITDFATFWNGMPTDADITIDDVSIITPYIMGGFKCAMLIDHDANNTEPATGTYTFTFDGLSDGSPPRLDVDWEVYLTGTFAGLRND